MPMRATTTFSNTWLSLILMHIARSGLSTPSKPKLFPVYFGGSTYSNRASAFACSSFVKLRNSTLCVCMANSASALGSGLAPLPSFSFAYPSLALTCITAFFPHDRRAVHKRRQGCGARTRRTPQLVAILQQDRRFRSRRLGRTSRQRPPRRSTSRENRTQGDSGNCACRWTCTEGTATTGRTGGCTASRSRRCRSPSQRRRAKRSRWACSSTASRMWTKCKEPSTFRG